jgi:RNA polymerase sigma factor for flagellar operon FliA
MLHRVDVTKSNLTEGVFVLLPKKVADLFGDMSLEGQQRVYAMFDENIELANTCARLYLSGHSLSTGCGFDCDDVFQWARIGLFSACITFDVKLNGRFDSYARYIIKYYITDRIRENDPVIAMRRYLGCIDGDGVVKMVADLRTRLERGQISKRRFTPRYLSIRVYCAIINQLSLDQVLPDCDEPLVGTIVDDSTPEVSDVVHWRLELKRLVDICRGLDKRSRHIFYLYFYRDLTLKDIGRQLRITESRVSQLLRSAIAWIRAEMRLESNGKPKRR